MKQMPQQSLVSRSVRDKKDAIQPQARAIWATLEPVLRLN
jgi:hypothetical protein